MLKIETINERFVRLTSTEKYGLVKETLTERTHSEVVCNKRYVGNFEEVVHNSKE